MSTIQTVKTQIQSLIDLANTTTGNTDTNLTDGVNALVSGFGQGGSGGMKNGYNVSFYDEDNQLFALFSIKQGEAINPPIFESSGWQDVDGVNIAFPYTPTNDIGLYPVSATLAEQLYNFYNVDSTAYPYVYITYVDGQWTLRIVFGATCNDHYLTKGIKGTFQASGSLLSQITDVEALVELTKNNISTSSLTSFTGNELVNCISSTIWATNYSSTHESDVGAFYRLDE